MERAKAEKRVLISMVTLLVTIITIVSIVILLKRNQSLQFNVDIKYEGFKLVDKKYYYDDGDSLDAFDLIKGFEVTVSKYYEGDNVVRNYYYKQTFVTNKDSIPSVVKSMKKDILKSRKQDERISKEIEEIKNSLEE